MLFTAIFAVAMAMIPFTQGCSPINFPDSIGFEGTMYLAPVVVAGTVTDLNVNNTRDDDHVTFSVECVYKKGNSSEDIEASISIDGRYKFHSCSTTNMEQDGEYVLALHNMKDGRYRVYEYNIASSAAYDVDKVDLAKLVELCGFENPRDIVEGKCQKPQAENVCRDVDVSSAVSVSAALWTIILSIAFLNM